jgi:pantoate--beta-alanine ligase
VDVPFEIFRTPHEMRAKSEDLRRDGRKIAVVPTMGALHEGHLALVRHARARADVVILTIFVNPTQFAPTEDLSRYPRDEAGDLAKSRPAGVNLAFCPTADVMYPAGAQTFIEVRELGKTLEGASRPGHFAGVATIVSKLFHITKPHIAVFGEKDYQQLAIIRRMTRDLDFDIDIQSVPIVREADGLAMSSRNVYLTAQDRQAALSLSRGLAAAEAAFEAGERGANALLAAARAPIEAEKLATIDYVEIKDSDDLTPIDRVEKRATLLMAVRFGTTRLIDNRVLGRAGTGAA